MAEEEKNLYKIIWEKLKDRINDMELEFQSQKEGCDSDLVKYHLDGQLFAIYLVKDFLEFLETLFIEGRER